MRIGPVLGRAFRALKCGPLWAFFASAAVVAAIPVLAVGVASWYLVTPAMMSSLDMGSGPDAQMFLQFWRLYATLIFGMILSLPVVIVLEGGLIHLSDNLFAGRPVTVAEGWSFGLRRFFRTLGFELLTYLAYMLALGIAMVPFFLLIALGGAAGTIGDSDSPVGLFAGMCFGYLWFFVAMFVVVFFYMAIRYLGLRYTLIGGRDIGDSIVAGFKAVRHAFKPVFIFTLAMIGIMYGYQTVTYFITMPIYFATAFPSMMSDTPDVGAFTTFMWIVYPLAILLYLPLVVFNTVAWTSFFRALTGLDVLPPAPQQVQYQPPMPPMAPMPPTAPVAPETPVVPPVPPLPPGPPTPDA